MLNLQRCHPHANLSSLAFFHSPSQFYAHTNVSNSVHTTACPEFTACSWYSQLVQPALCSHLCGLIQCMKHYRWFYPDSYNPEVLWKYGGEIINYSLCYVLIVGKDCAENSLNECIGKKAMQLNLNSFWCQNYYKLLTSGYTI